MLEKIAKLLNQAENAGTQAEADAFMERAQKLATLHSVDLAKARHATLDKQRTIPVQRTIHIGERGSRGLRTLCDLAMGIGGANDLRFTIAHDATRVYAVGFAEDIDITEAMFASLQVQQAKFLDEFKRQGDWKNETVYREACRANDWCGDRRPQTWLTARLNFQESFASRIGTRLHLAKRAEVDELNKAEELAKSRPHIDGDDVSEHFKQWFFDAHGFDLDEDDSTAQELRHALLDARSYRGCVQVSDELGFEAEMAAEVLASYIKAVDAQGDNDGTALVLVEKNKAIDKAYAPARARARGSYRGGTSGARSHSGQSAGRSAADRASLGRGTAIGGTKGALSA